jgi:hypothetical protein
VCGRRAGERRYSYSSTWSGVVVPFPGWGLTSAAFGATLSWVRLERDEEVGGVKRLFPVEVLWDSTGGAKGAGVYMYK